MRDHSRNNSLDAIRSISAFGVIFAHTLLIPKLKVPDYLHHIDLMTYFVQVFFVLSALSLLLNNKFETVESIRGYYIKRFFRIAPLFYFFIVLYSYFYTQFDAYNLFLNITFLFGVPTKNASIVWAGWTLGVEAIFYFVLPVFFILLKGSMARILFCSIVVIASLLLHGALYSLDTSATDYQASFFANMGCFALGALIFELLKINDTKSKMTWKTKTFFYVAALLLTIVVASDALLWLGPYLYNRRTLYGLVGFLIIYAEMRSPSSFMLHPAWSQLAKLSYGIYLWHPLIIYNLNSTYVYIYQVISMSNTLAYLVCVALTIVVVTFCAVLTYALLEKPMINLGRKFARDSRNLTPSPA